MWQNATRGRKQPIPTLTFLALRYTLHAVGCTRPSNEYDDRQDGRFRRLNPFEAGHWRHKHQASNEHGDSLSHAPFDWSDVGTGADNEARNIAHFFADEKK